MKKWKSFSSPADYNKLSPSVLGAAFFYAVISDGLISPEAFKAERGARNALRL